MEICSIDWGIIPDWIVAVGTIAIALGAFLQLKHIASASREQADVARADLMLKIDQIYEGPDMAESRIAVQTLRNQCEAVVKKERPGAADSEVFARSATLFSGELTKLFILYKTADKLPEKNQNNLIQAPDDQSGARYALFMRLPYWMETVGLLTKKELLKKEDVLDLYDAAFISMMTLFEQHVYDRRDNKPFGNRRFLEHALWVMNEAREQEADWAEVASRPPSNGVGGHG